jgi:hypothetical protein
MMNTNHAGEKVGDCGCRLVRTETGLHMQDCPVHATAEEFMAVLKIVAMEVESAREAGDACLKLPIDGATHQTILQVIAKGEGKIGHIKKETSEIIGAVYDKYKHLDKLLSDPLWLDCVASPERQCLFELWQAIKQVKGEQDDTDYC